MFQTTNQLFFLLHFYPANVSIQPSPPETSRFPVAPTSGDALPESKSQKCCAQVTYRHKITQLKQK